MAAGLQHWPAAEFESSFGYRERCTSPEGRRLAEIIDRNDHAMIQASLLGRPALATIFSLLPDDLVRVLSENDGLMQAFGHLARLEMNFLGFEQVGSENLKTYWPFEGGREKSKIAVFRRAETPTPTSSSSQS